MARNDDWRLGGGCGYSCAKPASVISTPSALLRAGSGRNPETSMLQSMIYVAASCPEFLARQPRAGVTIAGSLANQTDRLSRGEIVLGEEGFHRAGAFFGVFDLQEMRGARDRFVGQAVLARELAAD